MPTIRTVKNKNFTVMSNYHLRDKNLSLKAKGLLSLMLSLPENWNYSLKGLSCICKEGVYVIRNCVRELEKQGYIKRQTKHNTNGYLPDTEYFIYEMPPYLEKPYSGNPILDNPALENPILENCTQINKDITNY